MGALIEIIARFGPNAFFPYASSVIGKPRSTAFENKTQNPIAVDSEAVQLKNNFDPMTPIIKHKIAPKKKLNRTLQSKILDRSKFNILKKRNIGIAMV